MPRKKPGLPHLKKRRDFLCVARKGRKWATPGLVLQAWGPARPNQLEDNTKSSLEQNARIGYTVSRKVGNAIARNRAKRRLRAVAGQVLPAHARAGTDIVIIGRLATLTRPFEHLVSDLKTALKKLNCYAD